MRNTKMQEIKIRTSAANPFHLFEWNPGNEKWYLINPKQIFFCNGNPAKPTHLFQANEYGFEKAQALNSAIRTILNSVHTGLTVTVGAHYSKPQKKLIIHLKEEAS